ncbi:cholesterol oxidase [Branchiibius hedensis]|uniref:Cholesterol oxidase n=1 Tax=Branchiibius hedensis TaxID=672460 RepID=A0A2Y9C1V3_9MICO|nr:GMC family oxidoreductase [Branchiibius hedensis]PWJ26181.1 cholesterol oxidase [Branchiibius hedensis]SSA34993.1 cholesterol oxidase [Branchiibius hedensis]
MTTEYDHDVVVIGSGFGGAVSAMRLAEKGYSVLVYEAGRRFEDKDFAKTSWRLNKYLWAPALKLYGVQRYHVLPNVMILAGAGVGGGSLNYANTLYKPPSEFFKDQQWGHITDWEDELSPHYETGKKMLGVVEENPCWGPVEQLMKDTAEQMGVGHTFRKTPVGVFFGEPDKTVEDPFFGGEGPARTGCTECGNCMVGCRVGAKNTLMKNYLAFAEKAGARIEPMRTVTTLESLGETEGFRITTERTGAWAAKKQTSVTARHVVLAAGTWGTQQLLHKMKASGTLPKLSPSLGVLTRTNSEELAGAATMTVPKGVDLTTGVAITTSFHVDETTHVENCRYGKGSNVMKLLVAGMVDGEGRGALARFAAFGVELAKSPVKLLMAGPLGPGWSERTIIGLVMQVSDNSITVSAKKKLTGGFKLTSKQGHGAPNPTWLPQGHAAAHVMADKLATLTGKKTIAGTNWAELANKPLTAHFLGGVVISDSPEKGVIDPYHRVWGYPGLFVTDGSAVSANLGVNPSLTITAQAERAAAMWPVKGQEDQRPTQGSAYERLDVKPNRVPGTDLGMPKVRPLQPVA